MNEIATEKKDYTGNRKSRQNSKPMKMRNSPWKKSAVLAAVALAFVGAVSTVNAASIALNGQVAQRPLTPGEISSAYGYSLTNAQFSAGIGTVALGEPVYLDAMVTASIASSNIVGVIWALTNKPMGSLAALTNSPLGTNVPIFKTGDRVTGGASGTPSPYLQLAGPSGRTFFRPDFVGQYTVLATITTTGSNGERTSPRSRRIYRHDHYGVHLLWRSIC